MKKLTYLLFISLITFFASCTSCSKKEAPVDPLDIPTEFEESLTGKDTAAVKEIIGIYMDHIMKGDFYDAAGMVYRYELNENDQRVPRELNNEEMDRMVKVYRLFPVEEWSIDYMRFRETGMNEVCINVIMRKGENGQPDATSKIFFNPIFYGQTWCLVLDDTHQGTHTFVPAEKRDSMTRVYRHSKSGRQDAAGVAPKAGK